MTTNLHDKMLAAIDAYFSASDAVEEEVAENLLLDVRDELLKQPAQPAQQEPVLWQILNGVCHAGVRSTENLAKEAAAGMQKTHDLGGSLAAFHVRPLYTTPQAQQVPLTDIYRSFEQWKNGNVLEHGMPRTEYYSEAQLDLVEMGWKYGYDAGLAEQPAQEAELRRLHEVNQELLEALKAMVNDFDGCYADAEPSMINARAAIAKATKENT